MIKLKTLIIESIDDSVIEKFLSLIPKYGLEYHQPLANDDSLNKNAFSWRGSTYPTITDKEHIVQVALDRTDIFGRDGHVWGADPSRPLVNGYVLQAIVTKPEHRGQGKAKDILKKILQAADEAGLLLKLEIAPMKDFIKRGDKKLSRTQLEKWYARHGFQKAKDVNIMTRMPKSIKSS